MILAVPRQPPTTYTKISIKQQLINPLLHWQITECTIGDEEDLQEMLYWSHLFVMIGFAVV